MQATFRIAGYDSFEEIAHGGMAVVYKARKQSLKKTVAVKVLHAHLAADARFVARFQQEAEAAARVQHDNIVNVIDYGRADTSYYIVMEFYDGKTVEELLRARERMPVDVALAIALHVANGLDAAHAERLVHRDVKPANIILTRQGAIKIADFGLAKDVESETLVTHAGKVVGTPAYMSPEQTRGEPVDRPTDVFSLGVVMYEMLAGKRPFEGSSFSEVVDRIQSFDPPSPAELNPEVDESIAAIVKRMMTKAALQRPQGMMEVAGSIDTIMAEHGFQVDRRALKAYCDDPVGYVRSPDRPGGVRGFLGRFARPVPVIEQNAGKSREAAAPAAPDPALDYRVTLLAIDRSLETPESFALKLSMRLKAPLPRMRSLASRAPCVLVDRLPYKKARWLVAVVKELGGDARMDAIADARAVPQEPAPSAPQPQPRPEPAPAKPERTRRVPAGAIICPNCGWEEDARARFCSMCKRSFNRTDKIDINAMRQPGFADPAENPLQHGAGAHDLRGHGRVRLEVPGRLLIGVGIALVLLPLIIVIVNLSR